jgi:hypothetical protein
LVPTTSAGFNRTPIGVIARKGARGGGCNSVARDSCVRARSTQMKSARYTVIACAGCHVPETRAARGGAAPARVAGACFSRAASRVQSGSVCLSFAGRRVIAVQVGREMPICGHYLRPHAVIKRQRVSSRSFCPTRART